MATLPKTKGNYTISFNSRDLVGNDEATKTANFTIGNGDTTAPVVNAIASPSTWTSGTVWVTVTATDASAIGGVETRYVGAPKWDTRASGVSFDLKDIGGTLEYRAWDSQDNTSTGTVDIKIDTAPPTITSDVKASYLPTSGAIITLTSKDASSGLAGTYGWIEPFSSESSGTTLAVPAAEGPYTLHYRALDLAGNETSGAYAFTVTKAVAQPKLIWRFRKIGMVGNYLWSPDAAECESIKANLSTEWAYEGESLRLNPANPDNSDTMWRFKNKKIWSYFYTADPNEMQAIRNNPTSDWAYEGPTPGWKVSVAKPTANPAKPVWRFACLKNTTYLWTSDAAEKASIEKNLTSDYKLEGISYYLGQ